MVIPLTFWRVTLEYFRIELICISIGLDSCLIDTVRCCFEFVSLTTLFFTRWWPLRRRLKKVWRHVVLANALRYIRTRHTKAGYIFDWPDAEVGERKRLLFDEAADLDEDDWLYNLVLAVSGDATEKGKGSFTPILVRLLSLPPWLRDKLPHVIMTLLLPQVQHANLLVITLHVCLGNEMGRLPRAFALGTAPIRAELNRFPCARRGCWRPPSLLPSVCGMLVSRHTGAASVHPHLADAVPLLFLPMVQANGVQFEGRSQGHLLHGRRARAVRSAYSETFSCRGVQRRPRHLPPGIGDHGQTSAYHPPGKQQADDAGGTNGPDASTGQHASGAGQTNKGTVNFSV
jgi:hypothetical protein